MTNSRSMTIPRIDVAAIDAKENGIQRWRLRSWRAESTFHPQIHQAAQLAKEVVAFPQSGQRSRCPPDLWAICGISACCEKKGTVRQSISQTFGPCNSEKRLVGDPRLQ